MSDVTEQAVAVPPGHARIHYYRPDGNYAGWTVYTWLSSAEPDDYKDGPDPVTSMDEYGAYFDVKLIASPTDLKFIIHNPSTAAKDPGPDMNLAHVAEHPEIWVVSGETTVYPSQPTAVEILRRGFESLQAYWIDRHTIAIQPQFRQSKWAYALAYSPDASLQVTASGGLANVQMLPLTAGSFSTAQGQKYPQLAKYAVYRLDSAVVDETLAKALRSQICLAATDAGGALKYLTGVQSAGVLDDLFPYDGALGPSFDGGVQVRVWAPTAQSVRLLLYGQAKDVEPLATVAMNSANGVWTALGDSSWRDKYYLLSVTVYVPALHRIVTNTVTDPYSADLALNGAKTRLTDLRSPRTLPEGWRASQAPPLRSKRDFSVYELHVRDFSVADASVPAQGRGTYFAFTDAATVGMRHLRMLAEAGMAAVHLLPTFHFASVNEDKATWQDAGDLSAYPPDSTEQQARVAAVEDVDGYNWGYDPVHYFTPEGSYAVDSDDRVKEYRSMVMGLHKLVCESCRTWCSTIRCQTDKRLGQCWISWCRITTIAWMRTATWRTAVAVQTRRANTR